MKQPSQCVKTVFRVSSTGYDPNLHHLSGKAFPRVRELMPKSEQHEPNHSALNS